MSAALALTLATVTVIVYPAGGSERADAAETAARSPVEASGASGGPEDVRREKPPARPVPAERELRSGSDPRRPVPQRGGAGADRPPEHPNIVVVLTDDLDARSISHMPKLQALLVEEGTTLENAFVTDPMCCPARATFLRGQYPHNTKIRDNSPPLGGHEKFRRLGLDRSTVATWLDDAGYETLYAGKYMNGYDDTRYVPPGWDRWFGWLGNYHSPGGEYHLNENGSIRSYDLARTHDTDLLRAKSVDFIREQGSAGRPFFMYVATNAPHTPAYVPGRHEGMFSRRPLPSPPSMNEENISDKPAKLREQGRLDRDEIEWAERLYRKRLAAVQSVDDMIGALVDALQQTGQLDNTYVLFTSDNGFLIGEHRRMRKSLAYEESIRVPLLVRGPGVPVQTLDNLVINNDLAPTVADLAGVSPPGFVDGRSFAPLLERTKPGRESWRTGFLVEHVNPAYRALRTNTHTYVEWDDGARELYDLSADPYQLRNIHQTADRTLLASLENRLERLEDCARHSCRAAEMGP